MKFDPQSLGPKTWNTFFTLDSFDTYRREIEAMIKKEADLAIKLHGPNWIPKSEGDQEMWEWECQEAKRMHEEVLSPMFQYSLVVLLYSLFETELIRVVGVLEHDHPQRPVKRCDLAGDGISQCMKYLEVFEKIQNPKGWTDVAEINQLRLVRNCIVHCNGHVSSFSEKQKLLDTWSGNGAYEKHGILCVDRAPIFLSGKFLSSKHCSIWEFFSKLFTKFKWPVAEHWILGK